MSESIQALPVASPQGSQSSKHVSNEMAADGAENTDLGGFTAVFAQYVESEPDAMEQQSQQQLADMLGEMLSQSLPEDGKTLPDDEQAILLQAMLVIPDQQNPLQPGVAKASASAANISDVLQGSRQPALLNQDYFQLLTAQNQQQGKLMAEGFKGADLSAQLAASQLIAGNADDALLNMADFANQNQNMQPTFNAALSATGFGSVTHSAATQTQLAPLNLGQPAWEANLGSNLKMLVGQNIQSAELRLDPPELGSLDIKIKVSNDVASVNITSPHANVRDALENAVPRLREMFADSGVALGDVNVQQESFAQSQQSADQGNPGFSTGATEEVIDEPVTVTRRIVSDRLLDAYA